MLDGEFTRALGRLNSEISKILSRLTTKEAVLVEIVDEIRSYQGDRETLKARAEEVGYVSAWPY